MMKLKRDTMIKKIYMLLIVLFLSQLVQSQSYPVQITTQIVPPAPVYFADYANKNITNSPLNVQLLLRDITIKNRQVKLKIYFSGKGIVTQSKNIIIGADPIFLEGGRPIQLKSIDLAPYFQYQNIQGISSGSYAKELPEGTYQFCFEVYDVLTNRRLSDKSCNSVIVLKNNPPLLVAPVNNSNVTENIPQNIVFQWTPRNINVSNVVYELSIVEVWDNQVDPQTAFLTTKPIFQTTTRATSYVYGPSDPILLSDKKYVWRVQAKAKSGAEDIGLFKNRGYSQINSFSYASPCDIPLNIKAEPKGANQVNISWEDLDTNIPEFSVRYRKQGNTEWFYGKTTSNWITIWDLKSDTVYEYQVNKKCSVFNSNWSSIKTIRTKTETEASEILKCGITPKINLDNVKPLQSIKVNDSFKAADFDIKITDVKGGSGRFTGKGYTYIPYLNNIRVAVEFTNVLINADKQLVEGMVITTYDINAGNVIDADKAIETVKGITDSVVEIFQGENDLKNIEVDFEITEISNIKVSEGKIIITNSKTGNVKTYPANDDAVIVDSKGNVYHIDAETGTVTKGGEMDYTNGYPSTASLGNIMGVKRNGDLEKLTAPNIITFKSANDIYGFDEIPINAKKALSKYYKTVKDTYGNAYTLTHQAVAKGRNATIIAEVLTKNKDYKVEDIIFKTKQGEKLKTIVKDDKTIEVALKGRYSFEYETIYAVVKSKVDTTRQLVAGAFTLWHLTPRTVDVKIVPINNSNISKTAITAVQKIFNKGVATINIEKLSTVTLDNSIVGDNGLDIGDSPWLSAYNKEQRKVIKAIKSKISYSKNTYYVFVFGSDIKPSKDIAGFMPLQRQYGFVFSNKSKSKIEGKETLAHTLAHEIGHGVFGLNHPFTKYEIPKRSTKWLMDYGEGVQLSHLDWAQIHNPELKFYFFQDEKDGEYSDGEYFEKLLQQIRCAYVSGVDEISMPQKYLDITKETVKFKYGTDNRDKLNRPKVLLATIRPVEGSVKISGIQRAKELNKGSLGKISFKGLDILITNPVYVSKEGILPFEHFKNYLFPTSESIVREDYQKVLNDILKNQNFTEKNIEDLKRIANCGAKYFTTQHRYALIHKITFHNKYYLNEAKEDLILDLIENSPYDIKEYSNELLGYLSKDYRLLKALMNRMKDDKGAYFWKREANFSRFLGLIYYLWKNSDYSKKEKYTYVDVGDTLGGDNYLTPNVVLYNGKSWIPNVSYESINFYPDNLQLNLTTVHGQYGKLKYKYFQPVHINFGKNENKIKISKLVPAIYFAGIVERDNLDKSLEKLKLTVDLGLTFSGIGAFTKLKYLTNLQRLGKITLGTVEISSGVVDVLINYAELCEGNEKFCSTLQEYNLYLQMALLGSGLITSKYNSVKEAVKKQYLKSRDKLVSKYGENSSTIKELDVDLGLVKKASLANGVGKVFDEVFEGIEAVKNLKTLDKVSIRKIKDYEFDELLNIRRASGLGERVNIAKVDIVEMNKSIPKSTYKSHSGFDNFQSKIPDGSPSPRQSDRIFDTYDAPSNGKPRKRHNDSEVKILEELANDLGAKKGDVGVKSYKDIKGKITIKSQLCPCGSCSKVIEQFNSLFPEINIEIITKPLESF